MWPPGPLRLVESKDRSQAGGDGCTERALIKARPVEATGRGSNLSNSDAFPKNSSPQSEPLYPAKETSIVTTIICRLVTACNGSGLNAGAFLTMIGHPYRADTYSCTDGPLLMAASTRRSIALPKSISDEMREAPGPRSGRHPP
ncbi:hypothetical protein Bbelb_211380 [Branchiostoma belcheri]|nr:hypothetical protein Bbelb_211380 [Branchiostoma belcheri]